MVSRICEWGFFAAIMLGIGNMAAAAQPTASPSAGDLLHRRPGGSGDAAGDARARVGLDRLGLAGP